MGQYFIPAFIALLVLNSSESSVQFLDPKAYCGWQIDDASHRLENITGDWLVPDDGCLLSLLVSASSPPGVIDGGWVEEIWIEIDQTLELGVASTPQARRWGWSVLGWYEQGSAIQVTMTIIERTPNEIMAQLIFKSGNRRFNRKVSFLFAGQRPSLRLPPRRN